MKKRHLLWITPGFAEDEQDLNCMPYLQFLAKATKSMDIDLEIIALTHPANKKPYFWHDIPVHCAGKYHTKPLSLFNWLMAFRIATKIIKEKKINAIHSFWLGPCWLIGIWLSKLWNIPQITTLMGQDVASGNKYLRFLKLKHVANLVSVSNFQNQVFEKQTKYKTLHVNTWGIDPLLFPIKNGAEERPIDIMGCGSLENVKNWPLWIEVIKEITTLYPNIKAVLIGKGSLKSSLLQLINNQDLSNNIRILDNLKHDEVMKKMQSSKVLLHTASFESFGYIFIEALANGCRIVSTPVGEAPLLADCGETRIALSQKTIDALNTDSISNNYKLKSMTETAEFYVKLLEEKSNPQSSS